MSLKIVVCALMLAVASANMFAYQPTKVGEWEPPAVPEKESNGLKGKVPAPAQEAHEGFEFDLPEFRFQEAAFKAGNRKLLAAAAPVGGKVPHNWFGQGKYVAPAYEIATGYEECKVCKMMIEEDKKQDDGIAKGGEGAEAGGAEAGGKRKLCNDFDLKFKDMCEGYSKYLQDCPSFEHNICHEDLGGAERLRAPCPDYLKCYYCLRINPLYCLE